MGAMDNESKKNFIFYESWLTNIDEEYKDEKTKQSLVYAIVRYGIDGKKTYPCERLFLKQVFAQIDSAKEKWENLVEARKKAGEKGGKAANGEAKARYGNKNASKTQANASKRKLNENDNVNVNEKDNDNNHSKNHSDSSNESLRLPTREELEARGVLKKEERREWMY